MLQLILVAMGTVALIATFWVYYRQLLTMQKQLSASQQASVGQNILSLANFLQAEDVRNARTLVIESIDSSNYPNWTTNEKQAAAKVCSSYHVAGLILKTGVFPADSKIDILKTWGASIGICHDKLKPYVTDIRKQAGSECLWAYEWFFEKTVKAKAKGMAEPIATH